MSTNIDNKPQWKHLTNPFACIALGFGSGLSLKAPGTTGSLFFLVVVILGAIATGSFNQANTIIPTTTYLLVLALLIIGGTLSIQQYNKWLAFGSEALNNEYDSPHIVVDEFAGLWLALFAVPLTLGWLLFAFILFRFFDIVKPFPINWLDKHIKGSWGIMVDDLMAGLYSLLVLHGVKSNLHVVI